MKRFFLLLALLFPPTIGAYAQESKAMCITPFASAVVFYDALGNNGIAAVCPALGLEFDYALAKHWGLGLRGFASVVFPKDGPTGFSGGGSLVSQFILNNTLAFRLNIGYPSGIGVTIGNNNFCLDMFPQAELVLFQVSYGYKFRLGTD